MTCHDAILGAGRRHPDHSLRAQIRRDKREAGDPRWDLPAREKKVFGASDDASERLAIAEHKNEVDDQDRIIDPAEADPLQLVRALRLDEDHAVRAAHTVDRRLARILEGPNVFDVVWIEPGQRAATAGHGISVDHDERLLARIERRPAAHAHADPAPRRWGHAPSR